MEKEQKIILPVHSEDPVIGRWLWSLQDARARTLRDLKRVTGEMVDWRPDEIHSSIGSILYHIATIELDWLYEEVLVAPFPDDLMRLFSYPVRDDTGRISHVTGETLERHLARLAAVRARLLETFRDMDLAEFRRVRSLPHYDVTPEWVLHHLLQHEAEHRSEIGAVEIRFEQKNQ